MISFKDSEIRRILPDYLKNSPEIQAISYALNQQMKRYMKYCRIIGIYAMIDTAPDEILDMLAIELGTQYYNQSLNIEIKRKLIRHTLSWHARAGTPSAVRELVETVFGRGEIIEWFDFTEGPKEPWTFDIKTSAQMTEDAVNDFLPIIESVKNTRSHIRRILIERTVKTKWYGAIRGTGNMHNIIGNARLIKGSMKTAAAQASHAKVIILCEGEMKYGKF